MEKLENVILLIAVMAGFVVPILVVKKIIWYYPNANMAVLSLVGLVGFCALYGIGLCVMGLVHDAGAK